MNFAHIKSVQKNSLTYGVAATAVKVFACETSFIPLYELYKTALFRTNR